MPKMMCTCTQVGKGSARRSPVYINGMGEMGEPGKTRRRRTSRRPRYAGECKIVNTMHGKRKLCRTPHGYRFQKMSQAEKASVAGLGKSRRRTTRKRAKRRSY